MADRSPVFHSSPVQSSPVQCLDTPLSVSNETLVESKKLRLLCLECSAVYGKGLSKICLPRDKKATKSLYSKRESKC